MQPSGAPTRTESSGHFEVFQYPADPHGTTAADWVGWSNGDDAEKKQESELPAIDPARLAAEAAMKAGFEKRLGEETRKAFEAGREKGKPEGAQAERTAQVGALAASVELRKRQAAELVQNFAQTRDRFLSAVEREVVELALAVATRILRREAQMDPLLLTGAVRVALGQLSASTAVNLHVPQGDLDLWTEAIALIPNLGIRPVVVAGEGMRLGDCRIETSLGSVDLGIRSQLGEIERGFFDRLGGSRAMPASSVLEASPGSAKPPAQRPHLEARP